MNIRRAAVTVSAVLMSVSPIFADARSDAKSQVAFGINVAQRGLWREAIYRWEKAVELDPSYAPAYNDLAIVDGQVASVTIARLLFVADKIKDRAKTRQDLLEYCKQDTFATVRLVARLAELAK